MPAIYLKHTSISPERSVQTIISEVTARGATSIRMDHTKGVLVGLAFLLPVPNGPDLPIILPARVDAMKNQMYKDLGPRQRDKWKDNGRLDDSAYRICWAQLAAWVKAQMALVDLQIVKTEEVFLPYIQVAPGKTLFTVFQERGFSMKSLKAKEE